MPAIALLLVAACSAPPAARTVTLRTQNDSGVTGTVTLVAVTAHRTRVEIRVDPAGHPDMPAHIHAGTCDNLTPQPTYPLENVREGHSTTEIAAALADLGAGGQSLNIHHSNDNMRLFTACAELDETSSAVDPSGSSADALGHGAHGMIAPPTGSSYE